MIIENMPFDEYLKIPASSNSGLKLIRRSPAHFRYPEPKKQDSRAKEIGSAIHCAILEPDLFSSTYHVADADDRVSAHYKGLAKDYGGSVVLTKPEHRRVIGMQNAAYKNSRFAKMMAAYGRNELSVVTTDPVTGVKVKVRFDRKLDSLPALDLKKCQDARGDEFAKAITNYGYYMQVAFYADAWFWETGERINCSREFPIAAVEEDSPHGFVMHDLDEIAIELGRRHYREALNLYADCLEKDIWPKYDQESEVTSVTSWAARELTDDLEFEGI